MGNYVKFWFNTCEKSYIISTLCTCWLVDIRPVTSPQLHFWGHFCEFSFWGKTSAVYLWEPNLNQVQDWSVKQTRHYGICFCDLSWNNLCVAQQGWCKYQWRWIKAVAIHGGVPEDTRTPTRKPRCRSASETVAEGRYQRTNAASKHAGIPAEGATTTATKQPWCSSVCWQRRK